jgi:transcriptional regulator with XRE-family HTH domain
MGRRVKVAETKAEAKAEVDLVKELTGAIIRHAEAQGWTRQELARRAKKNSAVTLYAWRNGTRKNPSLLDLQAFANAVGLNVGLLPYGVAVDGTGGNQVGNASGTGRATLKPETTDVVKVMEGASDELRAAIKDKILTMVTERASHPLDADAEQAGRRVRSNKS